MGASISTIVMVVARGFLVLIIVSFFISVPLGYYFAMNWLEGFAIRINLSPLIFILSGIISFIVASLAIFTQSINAAKMNQVKTLRYE